MERLIEHADPRVRVEAIRGLAVLGPETSLGPIAERIGDDDDAVRSTALTVLGTSAYPGAEEILVESISSSKLSAAQRARAIELLGRKPTDETRALLERIAGKRLALTATARQIKAAARKALEVA
jgi:HEAT repeat protein